ncbi:Type 1 glutamine amidotransferase-like domain-containing protein [Mycolicibacterium gadium]|uniref:Type 1 glutamine amidotransferase-like domain-containing protein n=1 Tax=Mycolicibacterium gadium TaxID=1794 RepID=UPI002FDD1C34
MTEPAPPLKPVYLFADSRLLFWKHNGRLVLDAALDGFARNTSIRAAYVGASNGDRVDFYEVFDAAMDAIGIAERRMIVSSFGPADRAFMECAQLILLAGGDVQLGWATMEDTGMKDVILDRYAKGAVLVGISAGAVQLGCYGLGQTNASTPFEVFGLVRLVVDTHDERAGWARLARTIDLLDGTVAGLGIPSGGGVIVHPDATIEPLRRAAHEFRSERGRIAHSLLHPECR